MSVLDCTSTASTGTFGEPEIERHHGRARTSPHARGRASTARGEAGADRGRRWRRRSRRRLERARGGSGSPSAGRAPSCCARRRRRGRRRSASWTASRTSPPRPSSCPRTSTSPTNSRSGISSSIRSITSGLAPRSSTTETTPSSSPRATSATARGGTAAGSGSVRQGTCVSVGVDDPEIAESLRRVPVHRAVGLERHGHAGRRGQRPRVPELRGLDLRGETDGDERRHDGPRRSPVSSGSPHALVRIRADEEHDADRDEREHAVELSRARRGRMRTPSRRSRPRSASPP